ncbi:MAG: transcription termination/antitermination protein NusA [Anaerolineae bacterium]|nr:transcription termination/antitermination protein NusA [Anaerolineae bacterium]
MKSELQIAFGEIAEARALPAEKILEALRTALVSAYQREAGIGKSQRVEAEIDRKTFVVRLFVEKEVVEDIMDTRTEVLLEDARFFEPEAQLGDMVMVQVDTAARDFGRIAAQTAKQVILQKIREEERNSLFDEYIDKEGDIISGTVQSVNPAVITISLQRTEAVMPRNQQIPGERFKPHDKIRAYVVEVKRSTRGPQIVLSRSHRNMLRRLLEFEVPEIYTGQVEIKNIAREAGYRSKVAVAALQDGIDPVGACVGQRGTRIQNIVKELHDEKIDVIEWNANQEIFIAKALSPARVSGVYLEDDPDSGRTAVVIVPDDQLSLAIGREGQNARLAAKLTGWRIDIKSVSESVEEALAGLDQPPLRDIKAQIAELAGEAQRILEKRAANRVIMPEELRQLERFADLAQRRHMAARELLRRKRLEEINAVRRTLPQGAFQLPISALNISDEMKEALAPLNNTGEIMLRYLVDENRLRRILDPFGDDALAVVQAALDELVIPEAVEPDLGEAGAELTGAETPAEMVGEPGYQPLPFAAGEEEYEATDDSDGDQKDKKGKKKKGRQLVYDEQLGRTVAKRQRKQRGSTRPWEDFEE